MRRAAWRRANKSAVWPRKGRLNASPLTTIPLLSDTLITLLIFLTALSLGARVLRWLGIASGDRLERGLFAVTLGLGLLSFLPFVLFSVGAGRPLPIALGTLALGVWLLPETIRIVRAVLPALRSNPPRRLPAWA